MLPHERSLVKKFEKRPFVLLGVNSDGTDTAEGLAKYKEEAAKEGVTWRSFRNESTDPRISDVWRVQGWPTLFYIDHEGVIRHKDVREEKEMERVLDEMVAAAEKAAAK